MAFNIKNVLTTASIVLSAVDDSYKYQAELISSNGELFQPYDTDTMLTFRIYKGFEDVTKNYNDIIWRRFSFDSDNIEEDNEWGSEYKGSSEIILNKNEVDGKCLIQVDAYDIIKNKRTIVATARIILIDVNEMFSSIYPPANPIDGTIWIDTNMTPSTIKIWDAINKKWNEVGKSDQAVRNLIRNSNFWTLNTKYYVTDDNTYLYPYSIKEIAGNRCLRLYSREKTPKGVSSGLAQRTLFPIKKNDTYTFSFKVFANMDNTYTGDAIYTKISSVDNLGMLTDIVAKLSTVKNTQFVQVTISFNTISTTESLHIYIGIEPEQLCDFYITELSLYNTNTFYPWELAPEDVAEILKNQETVSHEEVLKALTNDGEMKGIYETVNPETGKNDLYISGTFIKTESIEADSLAMGAVSHEKLSEDVQNIVDNTYDRVKEWAYGAIEESTTINGGLIQTNTILANKLMLGDFSNLCLINPDSESGNIYEAETIKINGKTYFKFDDLLMLNEMYGNPTFKVGEVYRLSFEGATSFDDKDMIYFYIRQHYTDGFYVDLCSYQWAIDHNIKTHELEFKIENESNVDKTISHTDIFLSTEVKLLNESENYFFIRNILINKKASAEMIVDGAITADKIEADAINGKTITGATIKTTDNKFIINDDGLFVNGGLFSVDTAGNVVAKTLVITGDQIEAGTLSGDLFDQTEGTISGNSLMPNCIKSHHIDDGALDKKEIDDPIIRMHSKNNKQQITFNTDGLNINDAFKVDIDGVAQASNLAISGGSIDINSKFKVTVAGKMTSSDYALTNGSISKADITLGDNNEIVINKNGIDINNGAFKVSKDGVFTCKNFTIDNNSGSISGIKVNTDNIVNSAVTTDKLANTSVTESKLASDSVTRNKIKNGEVIADKLAEDSVTESKIVNDSVTADKIKNNAVTTNKIADLNISTSKLAKGCVTTEKIADLNITTGKVANLNITKEKLSQSLQDELKSLSDSIAAINETLASLDERLKKLEPEQPEEPEEPEA
jgi:hypothetical protein